MLIGGFTGAAPANLIDSDNSEVVGAEGPEAELGVTEVPRYCLPSLPRRDPTLCPGFLLGFHDEL